MQTVELQNPNVLVRLNQHESTKGKNSHWWTKDRTSETKQRNFSEEVPWSFIERLNARGTKSEERRQICKDRWASVLGEHDQRKKDRSAPVWPVILGALEKIPEAPKKAEFQGKGTTQKQKERPDQAKDAKPSSKPREQSASPLRQGNNAFTPYLFGEPVTPWFWSYPYYYTPLDYSRIYMHPCFIQYPSICPSYGAPQRPIVASDNLIKSKPNCSQDGEKDMKQDNKYLQPRWCPSDLSHTQKRRL